MKHTRMLHHPLARASLSPSADEHLRDCLESSAMGCVSAGADIHRALSCGPGFVRQPHEILLVLISDMFKGRSPAELRRKWRTFAAY